MNGIIVDGLEPIVSLLVIPQKGDPIEVIATLDTGSTGELTLPPSAIRDLELKLLRSDNAVLADGSKVFTEIYEATVLWFGDLRTITVYELDATPLLGMRLLQNCRLTMDIIPDGEFELVPLESTQE